MQEENRSFTYTYSAKEQAEIKKIRERYTAPQDTQTDKLEQLRRLDAGVTQKASVVALVIGIIGVLVMGAGMSLVMSDFSNILGSYRDYAMPIGIVIGVIGLAGAASAYPIYNHIAKTERKRITPEIIRLTDELMK